MSQTPEEPQAPQYGAPQPPQYGAPAPQGAPVSDSDRQTWSMLAYLGTAITVWVAPLIIWLIYKDRDATIKGHAAYNLNWGIGVVVGLVGAQIIAYLPFIGFIGTLLWIALIVGNLVLGIMGAIAVNKGQAFKYPFTLDIIK